MGQTGVPAYRLGLDLGTNSIGWFVIWLSDDSRRPITLGPGGVRVFPDGRDRMSGTSNAADRRKARGARRRRDRFLVRRRLLMAELVGCGLMPAEECDRKSLEHLDPYELRALALDGPLPAHHVGRALFHLNQRRGFLSNRKAERTDDGSARSAAALKAAIAAQGARTLGEFLCRRHRRRETVRARGAGDPVPAGGLFASRDLVRAEFDAIWDAQATHHAVMTREARERIARIVFDQRPLVRPAVGKCALSPAGRAHDPDGGRCPWAHPLAQRFRIFQSLRNVRICGPNGEARMLTRAEGDVLARVLLDGRRLGFDRVRKLLKPGADCRFNLEAGACTGLEGDATAAALAHRRCFGPAWRRLPLARRIAVVERLLGEDDEGTLIAWLVADCAIDRAAAERIAITPLPSGHCRLGLRAIRAVLPHMEDGLGFHEASLRAGFDPGRQRPQGPTATARLPYYGERFADLLAGTGDPRDRRERRFGRFANPTLHIGLGQLRRVVNALIARFGPPAEIAVEVTRALGQSTRRKDEITRAQDSRRGRNDARRSTLARLGLPANAYNLLKLKLWEELNPADPRDRRCPYSGEPIDLDTLMSAEVDIDHIVPLSSSRDDSAANKVVCLRVANRHKGRRTPHAAFAAGPCIDGVDYRWDEIVARAARLPPDKRRRFGIAAPEDFTGRGFLARQLAETGWLARVARHYLAAVTDPHRIRVVPGRITAMMRAQWDFDSLLCGDAAMPAAKNRADHRHHAVDALVVGLVDRGLVQRIAGRGEEDRCDVAVAMPWPSLRADLEAALGRMIVSHKPDHGRGGRLHEDTAYGLIAEPAREGANLVYRKPVESLTGTEIGRIRDVGLRETVRAHVAAERASGVSFADALRKLRRPIGDARIRHGLRRVRLLRTERFACLVPIRDRRDGRIYKAYSAGENFCIEIFETADGAWGGEAVRRFDANRDHRPRWRSAHPCARLVMRLHKGDLVRVAHDGACRIMVVHRLEAANGRLRLAAHNETGQLDRRHDADDATDPFRWLVATYAGLKRLAAEAVRVDELGRVFRLRPATVDAAGKETRPR